MIPSWCKSSFCSRLGSVIRRKRSSRPSVVGRTMSALWSVESSARAWAGEDRTEGTLTRFFTELGRRRAATIGVVCLDRWQAYLKVVQLHAPMEWLRAKPLRHHHDGLFGKGVAEQQAEQGDIMRRDPAKAGQLFPALALGRPLLGEAVADRTLIGSQITHEP